MTGCRSLFAAMILGLLVAPGVAAQAAESQPQTPFEVVVVSSVEDGIYVEEGALAGEFAYLYQCVFKAAGHQVRYTSMPLKRALYHLERGEIAVTIPLAQSDDRDRYAVFGGQLFPVEYVFLALAEDEFNPSPKPLDYVLVRGFAGERMIADAKAGVINVNEWGQAMEMLNLGRADVVVVPKLLVGRLVGNQQSRYTLETAGYKSASLYVADGPGFEELQDDLKAAIRECAVGQDG